MKQTDGMAAEDLAPAKDSGQSDGQSSERDLGKNIPEAPKDSFSFGVKEGKDGKESFLGDGKEDGEGKDGDDKDGKKDKEESFEDKLIGGMKDEMEKSKESGKKIVYMRISIKISDIKSAAEGGSDKMKAEKFTLYEDGSSKTEEIEVEMSKEEAQDIMDEINAEREQQGQGSVLGMMKGLFGIGGQNKGGVEEDKKDKASEEKEGKEGQSVDGEEKDGGITGIFEALKNRLSPAKEGATAVSDTKDVTKVQTEEEKEAEKKGGRQ